MKEAASRAAPPIRPPSMSGLAKSSFAFEGLPAAAIEDRGVVGYFLAVTLCNEVADMSVHVLSLLGSSSLAGADSPYGFVSKR